MKNLILITSLVCIVHFSFAQDILDSTPRDGAYDKDIRDGGKERMIQDYQHVREADVMWSTKIERVIDLREKINQIFYYPLSTRPIADRQNLIDVLMQAINEGTIIPYGNATIDDETNLQNGRDSDGLISSGNDKDIDKAIILVIPTDEEIGIFEECEVIMAKHF